MAESWQLDNTFHRNCLCNSGARNALFAYESIPPEFYTGNSIFAISLRKGLIRENFPMRELEITRFQPVGLPTFTNVFVKKNDIQYSQSFAILERWAKFNEAS